MEIAVVSLALVAAACVVVAISMERERRGPPLGRGQASRAIVRLGSWTAQAGAAARRGLRGAVPLASRARTAVTTVGRRALGGGDSEEEERGAVDEPPGESPTGRMPRVRFRDTLEMTDVQSDAGPSTEGLFGDGYPPEHPARRELSALRLALALVAIGFTIGLILLSIVVGIRALVG
jgi:hypothetical protein